MKTFLKLLEAACFWVGFGMIPVYCTAQIFVMRNTEVQAFILEYGLLMIYLPIIACLIAGWVAKRLENTPVPHRYSIVFGSIGIVSLVLGTFIYIVPQPRPISGLQFVVILAISLFASALSAAFHMKDEWKLQGQK